MQEPEQLSIGARQAQALPEQVWLAGQVWVAGWVHAPAAQTPAGL